MSWKKLSEKIDNAAKEKDVSLSDISEYLGIDRKRVEKMLNGDFSFDDRAHMREYLRRLSWILDLDFDDIWREFEEVKPDELPSVEKHENASSRFEIFMLIVLVTLSIVLVFEILDMSSKPCVVIENQDNEKLTVNDVVLEKGESYTTCESVKVYGNKGSVLIKTFGKKNYLVKIENFEVILDGRSEDTRSR